MARADLASGHFEWQQTRSDLAATNLSVECCNDEFEEQVAIQNDIAKDYATHCEVGYVQIGCNRSQES